MIIFVERFSLQHECSDRHGPVNGENSRLSYQSVSALPTVCLDSSVSPSMSGSSTKDNPHLGSDLTPRKCEPLNLKRFDLSLYLVTGRDLLPYGKVPSRFSFLRPRQLNLQSYLTSLEEVGHSRCSSLSHHDHVRRLFEEVLPLYRSAKRTWTLLRCALLGLASLMVNIISKYPNSSST